MEEVDSIVIQQLKDIGCELSNDNDDEITSLKELESHQVMICVAKCISVITGNDKFMAGSHLNQNMNMSNKYKAATELANKCLELGFKGDLGYQTFLYGNESDLRKLFLFLIERFPKDELPVSSTGTVRDNIEDKLRKLVISLTWLPPMIDQSNDDNQVNDNYNLWDPKPIPSGVARSLLINKVAPNRRKYYDEALRLPLDLISINQWNCSQINKDNGSQLFVKSKNVKLETLTSISFDTVDNVNVNVNVPVSASAELNEKSNPTILPKPARRTKFLSQRSNSSVDEEKKSDFAIVNDENIDQAQTIDSNENQIEGKRKQLTKEQEMELIVNQLEDELKSYQDELLKLNNTQKDVTKYENELKKEHETFIELQASHKSQQELKNDINSLKSDLELMCQQWQDVENELNSKIRLLKLDTQNKLNRSKAQRVELNELKKSITSKISEIKSKDALIEELKTKIPNQFPPGRNSYTKRIIEIVNNVKKQNQEINKVLLETRTIQKDINTLSGKLSRTFTVADELIFKEARNNEWNRKCYKLLASMHEHCDQLLSSVGSIGTILREIRQLEESIETERSKKTTSNLTRILADLNQIKLENEQMAKKLGQK